MAHRSGSLADTSQKTDEIEDKIMVLKSDFNPT